MPQFAYSNLDNHSLANYHSISLRCLVAMSLSKLASKRVLITSTTMLTTTSPAPSFWSRRIVFQILCQPECMPSSEDSSAPPFSAFSRSYTDAASATSQTHAVRAATAPVLLNRVAMELNAVYEDAEMHFAPVGCGLCFWKV